MKTVVVLCTLLLLTFSSLSFAQQEAPPPEASLLNRPMLESDQPTASPILRTSLPGLLDPAPSVDDPLPSPSLDPQDVQAPSPLLVRGPRLQPPASTEVDPIDAEPDPLSPTLPPDPYAIPIAPIEEPPAPQTTEELPFVTQPYKPPTTLAPDVLGVPNPVLDLAPGAGEELLPVSKVKLSKLYTVELRALLGGLYDDRALISSTGSKPDLILSVTPEVALNVGTDQSRMALRIAYAPLINWFTQGTNIDGVDHNALFYTRYRTEKLLVDLKASIATSISGGTLDSGPVSESKTYLAGIHTLYHFTAKTSFDATLDQTVLRYSGSNNSDETRLQTFGNYQWGNFELGLGTLTGFLDTQGASTQHYIQYLGRVIYTPLGKKLSFNATAGYEYRDLGGNQGVSMDPVFSLSASYLIFPKTILVVDATRQVYPSTSSTGQNYVLIGFNGLLRQSFNGFGRLFSLSLAGGVQTDKYGGGSATASGGGLGTGTGTGSGEDDYFYTRVSFDWAANERTLLGAYYEYSEDTSTRQGAIGFKRNRIGFRLSIIFF